MKTFVASMMAVIGAGLLVATTVRAGDGSAEQTTTVKGEVIDMVCYLDHGAMGAKHADCAKKCISGGLPVGLRTEDGKVYLLVGEHKPLNEELADHAAKTISVRGKVVSRDGYHMIENAEIVKE